ncbi:aldo/keto reductase [Pseudonocardia pini]|uniref:aldo/keto reductase n=1 Tax=Pseudonocardia pini TaxID=2758030 RepID=UPI0015F06638|nr:aldo/keto reductase [Pseudonocardia pini]
MEHLRLGAAGPEVSVLGLGGSALSGAYGPAPDDTGIATLHAALDAGITLIDTADFYGMGHNEDLIRRALGPGERDSVVLSLKFGSLRDPAGRPIGIDCRPASARNFLAYSLRRLGREYVDLYRPARADPAVPIEETVGALAELVTEGYVRGVGLSEVDPDTIRRAHAVHPITDVQVEYSLFTREIEAPGGVLEVCRELGIGVTAYGVLSRGLLSGRWRGGRGPQDVRGRLPRFTGDNVRSNLALVEAIRGIADRLGLTVGQLAVGWVMARRGEWGDIVAVLGSRTPEQVAEAVEAARRPLTAGDLAEIERAVPVAAVAGDRYPRSAGPAAPAQE